MINYLKALFSKKPYKFLGRTGIGFNDGNLNYIVNTNDFLSNSKEIEIFYKDINSLEDGILFTEREKREIALKLKYILEKDNYKVIISPPLPFAL